MSEERKIVTIDPLAGTVTTLADLLDGASYFAEAGSFQVVQGARRQQLAQIPGRYSGARVVGETLENDSIEWKALIKGSSSDDLVSKVEAMLAVTERATLDTFFKWRAEGATNAVYYQIAGPAEWDAEYDSAQVFGAQSITVSVKVPVLPVPRGDLVSQSISSFTAPAVVQLPSAVTGDLPALCDLIVRSPNSQNPRWGLLGWTKRPGSPISGSVAPFGVIEAETAVGESGTASPTGWAAGLSDSNYSGSNGLRISGAGTPSAGWAIDPGVMQPDDFTQKTVDIEVWARVEIASTLTQATLGVWAAPSSYTSFPGVYTSEYGIRSKRLVIPSSGTRFRLVRLGTLTLPTDSGQKWWLNAFGITAGTGSFGLDYLVCVPARQRCLMRTGVPLITTQQFEDHRPSAMFLPGGADHQRLIRSDLSSALAVGNTSAYSPAPGMGGSPIQLPPGNVDLLVLLSNVIPDDPQIDTQSNAKTYTSITVQALISPRYLLAR